MSFDGVSQYAAHPQPIVLVLVVVLVLELVI